MGQLRGNKIYFLLKKPSYSLPISPCFKNEIIDGFDVINCGLLKFIVPPASLLGKDEK
ncbi:MAG: hypothetical protein ACJAZX_001197 [Rickettsiales bacterium]|jgi:hypothetical protein